MSRTESIGFDEVVRATVAATQEVFNTMIQIPVTAGRVVETFEPIDADIVSIVGLAGKRAGYLIFAIDGESARRVTQAILGLEHSPGAQGLRDTMGEMANIIGGSLRSIFPEELGSVALGLPLIMSGCIAPVDDPGESGETAMQLNRFGAVVPFHASDGSHLRFQLIVFV